MPEYKLRQPWPDRTVTLPHDVVHQVEEALEEDMKEHRHGPTCNWGRLPKPNLCARCRREDTLRALQEARKQMSCGCGREQTRNVKKLQAEVERLKGELRQAEAKVEAVQRALRQRAAELRASGIESVALTLENLAALATEEER